MASKNITWFVGILKKLVLAGIIAFCIWLLWTRGDLEALKNGFNKHVFGLSEEQQNEIWDKNDTGTNKPQK